MDGWPWTFEHFETSTSTSNLNGKSDQNSSIKTLKYPRRDPPVRNCYHLKTGCDYTTLVLHKLPCVVNVEKRFLPESEGALGFKLPHDTVQRSSCYVRGLGEGSQSNFFVIKYGFGWHRATGLNKRNVHHKAYCPCCLFWDFRIISTWCEHSLTVSCFSVILNLKKV